MRRQHASTDGVGELRVGFTPLNLVPIDLDAEPADPEVPSFDVDSEDEDAPPSTQDISLGQGVPTSPRKKRSPPNYDPSITEKAWVLETFVKVGVPLMSQDWEASAREKADKAARREANRNAACRSPRGGMRTGALETYTRVTKPGLRHPTARSNTKSPDFLPPTQPVRSHTTVTTVDLASECLIPSTQPPRSNIAVPAVDMASAYTISSTQPQSGTTSSRERFQTSFQPPPALPQSPPPGTAVETVDLISSPADVSSSLPQYRACRRADSETAASGAALPERNGSPRPSRNPAAKSHRQSPRRLNSSAPEQSVEHSQAVRPLRRSPRHASKTGNRSGVDGGNTGGMDVASGKENVSCSRIDSIDLSMPTTSVPATKGSRNKMNQPTSSLKGLSSTQSSQSSSAPAQTTPTKPHSVITISSSPPQPGSTSAPVLQPHITPRSRARTKAPRRYTPSSSGTATTGQRGTQTSIRSWLGPGKSGAGQTTVAGRRLNRVEEMIWEDEDQNGDMPGTPSPIRTGTVDLTDLGGDEVAAGGCVQTNNSTGLAAFPQPDFHATLANPPSAFPSTSTPRKSTCSTYLPTSHAPPAPPAPRFSPEHLDNHTSKASSTRTPPSSHKRHQHTKEERDRSRRKRKQLIRLRESLEGVFAFVDHPDGDSSEQGGDVGGGRGAVQRGKPNKRMWRVSSVDKVDLTSL